MARLSLAMIVRNVERIIGDCLASIVPYVDEVVIVDTGSTDGSKEAVLRAAPAAVILDFNPSTHPEAFMLDAEQSWKDVKVPGPFTDRPMLADFGAARQFGWDRCTGDYRIWLDADDVVEGAAHLREIVDEMARDRVDSAFVNYDYASDDKGNVTLKLQTIRIARRGGARWHSPIHEVLMPIGAARAFDKVNVRHLRHKLGITPENQHRNLKVLVKWFERHPEPDVDPRMLFYLAMEERFIWPDRAIEHFRRYCQTSGWDEERGVAHNMAGTLHEQKAKYDDAFAEFAQAAFEASDNPDPFFNCARIAYHKKQWAKCAEWTERGFEVAKRGVKPVLMYDPLDRVYRPHIYYSVALFNLSRFKECIDTCVEGLKWNPDDPYLRSNKKVAEERLAEAATPSRGVKMQFRTDEPLEAAPLDLPTGVLATFAVQLWKRNLVAARPARARALLEALPDEVRSESAVQQAWSFTGIVASPPSGLHVVIWTGPAWEKWSPASVNQGGIGGSETAAACMARELVKLGCRVTVLSDIEREGVFDGARYVPYGDALKRPQDFACDVFVCSRQPTTFEYAWKFKVSFLWIHDIHVGQSTGRIGELLLKADRLLALSQWHKKYLLECYPYLHPDTVVVTRNGIDVDRFAAEPIKQGNHLIYPSSPDRGLERLIELLPRIRARVPDVGLHVYYGFDNWRKSAEIAKDQGVLDRIKRIEHLLASTEGVYHHGRVSQKELAEAFLASKVWAYPTWFTETFCISALEAQAAGCVPVTTSLAALSETVKQGILLPPPNTSEEYAQDFVEAVVGLLTNENVRRAHADLGRKWALAEGGWDKVAAEWLEMFERVIAEKAENPLPRFGDS